MDLGTHIRQARKNAGLTQMALAERLGVAQSAISQWEQGKAAPELATRNKLADVLRMRWSALLPEASRGENMPASAVTLSASAHSRTIAVISNEGNIMLHQDILWSSPKEHRQLHLDKQQMRKLIAAWLVTLTDTPDET